MATPALTRNSHERFYRSTVIANVWARDRVRRLGGYREHLLSRFVPFARLLRKFETNHQSAGFVVPHASLVDETPSLGVEPESERWS